MGVCGAICAGESAVNTNYGGGTFTVVVVGVVAAGYCVIVCYSE